MCARMLWCDALVCHETHTHTHTPASSSPVPPLRVMSDIKWVLTQKEDDSCLERRYSARLERGVTGLDSRWGSCLSSWRRMTHVWHHLMSDVTTSSRELSDMTQLMSDMTHVWHQSHVWRQMSFDSQETRHVVWMKWVLFWMWLVLPDVCPCVLYVMCSVCVSMWCVVYVCVCDVFCMCALVLCMSCVVYVCAHAQNTRAHIRLYVMCSVCVCSCTTSSLYVMHYVCLLLRHSWGSCEAGCVSTDSTSRLGVCVYRLPF